MPTFTISTLKQAVLQERVETKIHVQVESLTRKEARNGKPFWELGAADGEAKLTLRAWSDEPAFSHCEALRPGIFIEIAGEFSNSPNFGLEARNWTCRELQPEERDALLAGSPEVRARQEADLRFIEAQVAQIGDPRLRTLCGMFLSEQGDRLRRTAAARQNHHARRGGLIEHLAQMMRSAVALAGVYLGLNRDLLIAGVLFHDSGKLWENSMPADGFNMPYDERGEMLGHITIGIELVNNLWRKLQASPEMKSWAALQPPNEDVRLHLLHLLASHHGELQFGSPVVPKTPEGWALHYIDNLDAKLEMMASAYQGRALAPRIFERYWPLPGNVVTPLGKFVPEAQ
ncbi:MAG TPA: HD domain-containing protein [Chthoniobacteraceae bacterium]